MTKIAQGSSFPPFLTMSNGEKPRLGLVRTCPEVRLIDANIENPIPVGAASFLTKEHSCSGRPAGAPPAPAGRDTPRKAHEPYIRIKPISTETFRSPQIPLDSASYKLYYVN